MSQKLFHNNLVMIRKSKVTLKLKKLAYASMCILDLSKVFIHEFHCNCVKNKCGNNSLDY